MYQTSTRQREGGFGHKEHCSSNLGEKLGFVQGLHQAPSLVDRANNGDGPNFAIGPNYIDNPSSSSRIRYDEWPNHGGKISWDNGKRKDQQRRGGRGPRRIRHAKREKFEFPTLSDEHKSDELGNECEGEFDANGEFENLTTIKNIY